MKIGGGDGGEEEGVIGKEGGGDEGCRRPNK